MEDIDTQADDYYQYDRIGNLVKEGNDNITWTIYGKIRSITKDGKSIVYSYDPGGNRVRKQVTATVQGQQVVTTTWYVRDAQGNVLGVYTKKDAGPLQWKEQHLYGSSRLGIWEPNVDIASTDGSFAWNTVGNRLYELTNHLGNVMAVITDKRLQPTAGVFEAEVPTAHDYYPFGMQMPGRSIDAPDCHDVEQDLTELKASSDLNSGVTTQPGNKYIQNGITWQGQANGIVTLI